MTPPVECAGAQRENRTGKQQLHGNQTIDELSHAAGSSGEVGASAGLSFCQLIPSGNTDCSFCPFAAGQGEQSSGKALPALGWRSHQHPARL